jgi:hypothetical protein
VQPYLAITARRRFGNDYAVDNTQVFGTFRLNPTNEYHLPNASFRRFELLIIATILDIWLVRKHELSFCAFKPFRWLLAFCIDHLSDETKHFRWLMSTLGARPNHRNLLFFQFLDRTKTKNFLNYKKHKSSLSTRPIARISSTKFNRKDGFILGVNR